MSGTSTHLNMPGRMQTWLQASKPGKQQTSKQAKQQASHEQTHEQASEHANKETSEEASEQASATKQTSECVIDMKNTSARSAQEHEKKEHGGVQRNSISAAIDRMPITFSAGSS